MEGILTIKRILSLLLFCTLVGSLYAQSVTNSLTVNVGRDGNPDGSYTVSFENRNNSEVKVEFYLSYMGKRVSDNYSNTVPVGRYPRNLNDEEMTWLTRSVGRLNLTILTWPNAVPKGNEKYVTLQVITKGRDSRDDG